MIMPCFIGVGLEVRFYSLNDLLAETVTLQYMAKAEDRDFIRDSLAGHVDACNLPRY